MGKHNLGWGNLKEFLREDRVQDGDEERDRSCEVKDDGASQGEEMWKAEAAQGGETMRRTAGGSPLWEES